ncbi:hypothetical protein E4U43_003442 [Claviceps pusilla]|uniref:Uncharacterized protein n=1 Tax=Claviceps pusilla TaxID=123648 RepID=A0A9P7NFX6_9HYPO|nr:hypothetical protein E4U43_003442 [Claviceps pusilla]
MFDLLNIPSSEATFREPTSASTPPASGKYFGPSFISPGGSIRVRLLDGPLYPWNPFSQIRCCCQKLPGADQDFEDWTFLIPDLPAIELQPESQQG